MVENKGKLAAVITSETDEEREQQRQRVMDEFWETVERIGERNTNMDPDAELAFITEVVEEVRQERYEREQARAKNGR